MLQEQPNYPMESGDLIFFTTHILSNNPDSQVHGANMGSTWDPGGLHIGPMNLAIWESMSPLWTHWKSCGATASDTRNKK